MIGFVTMFIAQADQPRAPLTPSKENLKTTQVALQALHAGKTPGHTKAHKPLLTKASNK